MESYSSASTSTSATTTTTTTAAAVGAGAGVNRRISNVLNRRYRLPLTTGATHWVQLQSINGEYYLACFERQEDTQFKFHPKLREAHLVNNTTEKGPCLFLICPNGEFEFQADSKELFNAWLDIFVGCGVKVLTFDQLYRLQNFIGEGSFAKVYVGHHMFTGEEVVVKAVDKKKVKDSNVYTEIEVLRRICHPYIIRLFAAYEKEDTICLVLEYLRGGELFDRLSQHGPYTEPQARQAMKRVLQGLHYLHQRGTVHRDLKTENLILEERGNPLSLKIIDFGLASSLGSSSMRMRCGSPGYVAPEILEDRPYGVKVDLFSAGVILFTILAGYPPFRGSNVKEILRRNLQCRLSFNHARWANVSNSAMDLVLWMTNRDPERRFSAAEALNHPWFEKVPIPVGTAPPAALGKNTLSIGSVPTPINSIQSSVDSARLGSGSRTRSPQQNFATRTTFSVSRPVPIVGGVTLNRQVSPVITGSGTRPTAARIIVAKVAPEFSPVGGAITLPSARATDMGRGQLSSRTPSPMDPTSFAAKRTWATAAPQTPVVAGRTLDSPSSSKGSHMRNEHISVGKKVVLPDRQLDFTTDVGKSNDTIGASSTATSLRPDNFSPLGTRTSIPPSSPAKEIRVSPRTSPRSSPRMAPNSPSRLPAPHPHIRSNPSASPVWNACVADSPGFRPMPPPAIPERISRKAPVGYTRRDRVVRTNGVPRRPLPPTAACEVGIPFDRVRPRSKTGVPNKTETSQLVQRLARGSTAAKAAGATRPLAGNTSSSSSSKNKQATSSPTPETSARNSTELPETIGRSPMARVNSGMSSHASIELALRRAHSLPEALDRLMQLEEEYEDQMVEDGMIGIAGRRMQAIKGYTKTRDAEEMEHFLEELTASVPYLPSMDDLPVLRKGRRAWKNEPSGSIADIGKENRLMVTSAYFRACRFGASMSRASIMSFGSRSSIRGSPTSKAPSFLLPHASLTLLANEDPNESDSPTRRHASKGNPNKTVRFARTPSEDLTPTAAATKAKQAAADLLHRRRVNSLPVSSDSSKKAAEAVRLHEQETAKTATGSIDTSTHDQQSTPETSCSMFGGDEASMCQNNDSDGGGTKNDGGGCGGTAFQLSNLFRRTSKPKTRRGSSVSGDHSNCKEASGDAEKERSSMVKKKDERLCGGVRNRIY